MKRWMKAQRADAHGELLGNSACSIHAETWRPLARDSRFIQYRTSLIGKGARDKLTPRASRHYWPSSGCDPRFVQLSLPVHISTQRNSTAPRQIANFRMYVIPRDELAPEIAHVINALVVSCQSAIQWHHDRERPSGGDGSFRYSWKHSAPSPGSPK
jgi:hypothetical protein